MFQNQTQTTDNQPVNVDNDLQKAIDDITNNTNVDPVFSDPVAAPSSVPEGDTGELSEPVGPFPEPPKVEMPTTPMPEPLAPIDSMNIPELNPTEQIAQPQPEAPIQPQEAPVVENTTEAISETHNAAEIKKAALRDLRELVPLLNKMDLDNIQKFNVYRDIFEELKDYTVLEPAYQAAHSISDESKRAEALLYLVEAIDKM